MSWGKIVIAGAEFRETNSADFSDGTLRVTGQESHPPQSRAAVAAAAANMAALDRMRGQLVAVEFTDKVALTAFYLVAAASVTNLDIANGAYQSATWGVELELVGTGRDTEIESRVPRIARLTSLGTTPVYWHAPAIGYTSYTTGASQPTGFFTRTTPEGPITVFTGIPASASPHWTVPVADFYSGASRIFIDGQPVIGEDTPPSAVWQMDNGLVKVEPSGTSPGHLLVSCYDPNAGSSGTGAWASPIDLALTAGTALAAQPEMTVLRNDAAQCSIRLSYPQTPGRVTVDLSLRRGSRYVTGVIKRSAAATMTLAVGAGGGAAVTGGARQSAADSDGNRWLLGSAASSVTASATGLSKTATAVLDFFAGHEVGSPVAGDAFADLLAQYLGDSGEMTRMVRR